MIILAVTLYVLAQLGVGWWAARRTRTETDYFVAGRSLGLFPITLSLFATWFGAETVMGASAEIAEGGLAASRAEPFGYFITLCLMGWLVAGKLRDGGYVTLADFFRKRFGKNTETWVVVANVPASIVWGAAQLVALALIVHTLTDLPVQTTLGVSAILMIVYTSMGGLMGDVVNDVLQGIVLLIGLVVLLVFVVLKAGGPGEALALIDAKDLNLFGAKGESWLARSDAWAIPVFGSLVTSEAAGRFLGSKTAKVARHASFLAAGLYLLAGLVPVLIGLIGSKLGVPAATGDLFLPRLAQHLLPPFMLVILIGALLSAILSTVDSNILSASSLLTHNGVDRLMPGASEKTRLTIARAATVGVGLVAWAIAAGGQSIYDLIEWTSVWGTSGTLVAFLFGAWSGIGGGRAASAAIAAGVAVNLWTSLAAPAMGYEVEGGFLLSLAVSLVAYLAVGLKERGAKPQAA